MNEIKVGDGGTFHIGSDRYPISVIEVVSDKKVIVQVDDFRRIDQNEFSENQEYEFTANTDARKIVVTKRKNNRWYELGSSIGSGSYSFGTRTAYRDPSF